MHMFSGDQAGKFIVAELDEPTLKLSTVSQGAIAEKSQQQHTQQTARYNLTVVIPTRNERDNVRPLLETLKQALSGINVEVIFVDDSDDETPVVIEEVSNELAF